MDRTLPELAREALLVQDACNIGGVARSFAQAMADLHLHVQNTADRNRHPITIVWIDKLMSLAGIQAYGTYEHDIISDAFDAVRQIADSAAPVIVFREEDDCEPKRTEG